MRVYIMSRPSHWLRVKGNNWVSLLANCPKCSGQLFSEVTEYGTHIDHFCCSREGCTYGNHFESKDEIKSFLNNGTTLRKRNNQ